MSGPKVVRVVTREEQVAAGTSLLSRLDAAVQQWQRDCRDLAKPADVQATKSRRDVLAAMLAADKFTEFRQRAAEEIDFLQANAEERRERAAQAKAEERIRHENGRQLAKTLLRAGANLPPPMREELEEASKGKGSVADMDAVLSRARQALFSATSQEITAEQKALAQRLGVQDTETSFEIWKAKSAKPDVRIQSLFTHLAELDTLGFKVEADQFESELNTMQSIGDDANRSMRMDTLVLAVRRAKDGAIAKVKLLNQAELLKAELSATVKDSEALRQLRSTTLATSQTQLEAMVTMGRTELARLQEDVSAATRRKVVLDGLQKLGYQVQEGLATIAGESGRLIARSPANSKYGVELVTGKNQRLQVRSVAFDPKRDVSQDVAEEQRWCGDFSRLKSNLEEDGCEVVIEKALGVGAAPLRLVDVPQQHDGSQVAPKARVQIR